MLVAKVRSILVMEALGLGKISKDGNVAGLGALQRQQSVQTAQSLDHWNLVTHGRDLRN